MKGALDKKQFVYDYLSSHRDASISEIIRAANEVGLTISQGYISERRKEWMVRSEGLSDTKPTNGNGHAKTDLNDLTIVAKGATE